MIQKDNHPLFILKNEGIDHLHVRLLSSELNQISQILQTFGNHDQRPGGSRTRVVCDEIELSGVENGRTQQTEEDESGDGAGFHQTFVGPFGRHVALQAVANVSEIVISNSGSILEILGQGCQTAQLHALPYFSQY